MEFGDCNFARRGAYDGSIRVEAFGRSASDVAERIVMTPVPLLAGSLKFPVNVAPAGSTMVSPNAALLIACCRLPPTATVSVAACARPTLNRRIVPTQTYVQIDWKSRWADMV